jgi:hypothetical protein
MAAEAGSFTAVPAESDPPPQDATKAQRHAKQARRVAQDQDVEKQWPIRIGISRDAKTIGLRVCRFKF